MTAFGMEGSMDGGEAMYCYWYLFLPKATLASTPHSLSPRTSLPHLVSIAAVLKMGQNSWVTTEQLAYLRSWIPHLPCAKETITLQMLYLQAYKGFIVRWPLEPGVPKPGILPEQLVAKAKEGLQKVHT